MTNSKAAQGSVRALGIVLVYGVVLAVFLAQPALFEAAPGVRLWTPLAGLHLAVLVLFGSASLPVVVAAEVVGGLLSGGPEAGPVPLALSSLIVALGYGVAATWLRRVLGRGPYRALRLVKHLAWVALALPVFVGFSVALGVVLTGRPASTGAAFAETALQGWAAAAIGILTLTPLLLLAAGPRLHGWLQETLAGESLLPPRESRRLAAFGFELGGIALALYLAFVAPRDGVYPLYLCLLPVLWVAWRHGLGRSVLAVAATNVGIGLLLDGPAPGTVPVFMIVLALTGLVLGALSSERERTLAALNRAYDVVAGRLEARTLAWHDAQRSLEAQIQERRRAAASLQASVDELRSSRDALETAMRQQADLNEKLRASERQLKDLNVRKDKFFSIVSHDVKSMLVSAIGFSKLLISDADTLPREMVKEFASHVHSSSTNTYDLLENLLTWTRMQTGRMLYQRAWHGVDDLIQNNITMLQDNAARKGIQLSREGDREAQVYADRNMINSVLQNLISNAIKFTEHGGEITVSSRTFDQMVEIAVRDNGVGISPENLRKLFRIDVNHSTPGTDEEDGTGLGLVLCKEMIEKHEGRIWAESEPGKGSAFFFTLPCAAPAQEA